MLGQGPARSFWVFNRLYPLDVFQLRLEFLSTCLFHFNQEKHCLFVFSSLPAKIPRSYSIAGGLFGAGLILFWSCWGPNGMVYTCSNPLAYHGAEGQLARPQKGWGVSFFLGGVLQCSCYFPIFQEISSIPIYGTVQKPQSLFRGIYPDLEMVNWPATRVDHTSRTAASWGWVKSPGLAISKVMAVMALE